MSLLVDIKQKVYNNGTCTIEGMGFTAEQGEFIAIIGPSGTGKTTMLNIVAGLDQAFTGSVLLNGTTSLSADIGFMFQDARLMPWLTVRQNIELVLKGGVGANSITTLLNKVGLGDFIDSYPNQLSGGMKRRVSMVRAFINQPQLLLMDEPFQSLDEPTANTLRRGLLDLWSETKPIVLFVTHSLREALAIADRVIFLSDRPSHVIKDLHIDLPRPRELESESISQLHAQLHADFPALLSGKLRNSI